MVVLVDPTSGRLISLRPTLRARVRARLLASRYDRELAMGVPPEDDVCLALRAERLVRCDTRRWLARTLVHLLEEARRPGVRSGSPLTPASRRRLVESGDAVVDLVEDLERSAPMSSRGLASLCVLLRDGTGPLYGHGTTGELRERLVSVRRDLVPLEMW